MDTLCELKVPAVPDAGVQALPLNYEEQQEKKRIHTNLG